MSTPRRESRAQRIALASLLSTACAMAPAFGAPDPCAVHRSTAASDVLLTAPVALVYQSPFDDAPGLLADGQDYFYLVADPGGASVVISVLKNEVLGTVRIGFDDGDPLSAPVDASASRVFVVPDHVPADGVATAWVTIEPRDSSGVLLGSGLALSIDAFALWPGTLAGPVVDRGDGTYVAGVVSAVPGEGTVWVDVEGVPLDDEPGVVFENVDGLSLRDQALLRLQALAAPGGALAQLGAGLDPEEDAGAAAVAQATEDVLAALATLAAGDDADALRTDLMKALGHLGAALDDPGEVDPAHVEAVLGELLAISRLLAVYAHDLAVEACGPCGLDSARVCQAERDLERGDALAEQDPVGALNHYAGALTNAERALADCTP